MDAAELILAVPGEIMDNKVHDQLGEFLGAAGFMSEIKRDEPAWGTVDKARLAGLVERGRAGDLAAMEAIYEMFKRPVFNLQYRHTMNRVVAEDLLQDVFLRVFTHLKDVRDVATFPGWVFRIALNTCYSFLRQKKIQNGRAVPLGEMEGQIVDERADAVESDLKGPLNRAIQSLSPGLRSVFILHDVQGYKHEEISRLLRCSVGTSKSQLFKARMKLRAILKAGQAV
ncbi:MAG: RNA polymerase sigma factor [Candidatus Aminicenantales bacterium]